MKLRACFKGDGQKPFVVPLSRVPGMREVLVDPNGGASGIVVMVVHVVGARWWQVRAAVHLEPIISSESILDAIRSSAA